MIPKPIQIITIEDYFQIDYFTYKMDREGIYRSPQDLFWKGKTGVYYAMKKQDEVLSWHDVSILVDVSLTGRLYGRKE